MKEQQISDLVKRSLQVKFANVLMLLNATFGFEYCATQYSCIDA